MGRLEVRCGGIRMAFCRIRENLALSPASWSRLGQNAAKSLHNARKYAASRPSQNLAFRTSSLALGEGEPVRLSARDSARPLLPLFLYPSERRPGVWLRGGDSGQIRTVGYSSKDNICSYGPVQASGRILIIHSADRPEAVSHLDNIRLTHDGHDNSRECVAEGAKNRAARRATRRMS